MRLMVLALAGLLAIPAAMAQNATQEPPAAAGGATATPITPGEGAGAHAAPGASTEASPAAPPPPSEPAKAADVAKAVDCARLSQQFGDTLTALTAPTAKTPLDETVKATSSEHAGAGRKSCMAHDYDVGMDSLRQAITTLGKKPIV
jgi:hypothetical protein